MRVLVGCEFSGIVREAFRSRGHDAWSCDLLDTEQPSKYHIKGDIAGVLYPGYEWDLIILHPDCTALALSGNRWYGRGMPKYRERLNAISWTASLWATCVELCGKVCLENPKSVIFKHLNAAVQYIQPWMFGHGETKETGLALHGLPPLFPQGIDAGREHRIWKMPPSPTRKQDRSRFFPGIADAMAEQWGNLGHKGRG